MRACLFSIVLCFALSGNQLYADLFKNIDPPGAILTHVKGISGNKVVGYYSDSTGNGSHGFLYENSTYTKLDVPGVTQTTVTGISGNNVVGYFKDFQDGGRNHSYVFNGTDYTILKYPGASETLALAISGSNVVGYFYGNQPGGGTAFIFDGTNYRTLGSLQTNFSIATAVSGNSVIGSYNDSGTKGFYFNGQTTMTLSPPAAVAANYYNIQPTGIDGNNVVGLYYIPSDPTKPIGFLFDGTTYTDLVVPGATETIPYAVSGKLITGIYSDGVNFHGFVYDGTSFTKFDYPGAVSTRALVIDGLNIGGYWTDSAGINHGFITAVPEPGAILFAFASCGVVAFVFFFRRQRSSKPDEIERLRIVPKREISLLR